MYLSVRSFVIVLIFLENIYVWFYWFQSETTQGIDGDIIYQKKPKANINLHYGSSTVRSLLPDIFFAFILISLFGFPSHAPLLI